MSEEQQYVPTLLEKMAPIMQEYYLCRLKIQQMKMRGESAQISIIKKERQRLKNEILTEYKDFLKIDK